AYFLTKLVFCLFAEDVGLLPAMPGEAQGIFSYIIEHSRGKPGAFKQYVQNLFIAMNEGGSMFMRDIPYFNGTLFKVVGVETLQVNAIEELAKAAALNWESIEPSIFGTLFERSLDPNKRSQRGAHHTSREDILLIVEPVLMQPLRYEWDSVQLKAAPIRERYDSAGTGRAKTNARNQLLKLRDGILQRIRETTVLDPACGSGNFLYVSLQMLMDLEKEVIHHPLWAGLQMATREVHPRQMYGIEIDPIAQALASIVVWIGYIQWRINNGYGQEFAEPILEELEDNIVCKDAILPPLATPATGETCRGDLSGRPQTETVDWPAVDVIVGNPPFLGAKYQRIELGDDYVERMRHHFEGRIPAFVDLACYWFEKAREHIDSGQAKRAGLLATNSIRDGASREVLKGIKETGDIFMAWSDREWILEGAAVRISMVGFDGGLENLKTLDGLPVATIHADLTSDIDLTIANKLGENESISFIGVQKGGAFDITANEALAMIENPSAGSPANADVIVPLVNASDIVKKSRNKWIIDFGPHTDIEVARLYELPFQHVLENVYPSRKDLRRKNHRVYWWIHAEARPGMRRKISECTRYICTPLTSKHRIYSWLNTRVLADSTTVVIAKDDDYFFGILHSKIHEIWALQMAKSLGPTPRYTPTTTFETFPFPWSPGQEDESHPAHAAISAAAVQLHHERDAWLNPHLPQADCIGDSMNRPPPHADELPPNSLGGPRGVKDRTLTNLYNALAVFRGRDSMKTKEAAADFAPRLDQLHRELDVAVCAAYGWDTAILDDEEEMLRRLLALNLERAAS
ncbi:MAG: N-6 DNA methylase, partial [Chloroflexi bacterium]|nr:N-6 DNA methylase [Chloroflexota bacterium]